MRKTGILFFWVAALLLTGLCGRAYCLPQPWSFHSKSSLVPQGAISAVTFDPGGYLWIGSDDGGQGLTILDPSGNTFHYSVADGLLSHVVNSLAFENVSEQDYGNTDKGSIWIASDRGITVLDRNGVFVRLSAANSPLASGSCLDLFIDRENTKWISVRNRGVYCVDTEFNWHGYTRRDGLSSNIVTVINEDRRGNIWFGSHDNGVSRLDGNGNFTRFTSHNSGLISNVVKDIAVEATGNIWFLTPQGVSVFDGRNWMSYTSRNSPLGNFKPSAMAVDRFGRKWIGTELAGLFCLDATGRWQHFHRENSGLKSNRIEGVTVDSRGNVSILTPDGIYVVESALMRGDDPEKKEPLAQCIVSWKALAYTQEDAAFSLALPIAYSGAAAWFSGLFYTDRGIEPRDIDYALSGDRKGRVNLSVNGRMTTADFFLSGATIGSLKENIPDRRRAYPFPEQYPEELSDEMLPGFGVPSDLPAVRRIADSLISERSAGDMYATAREIVYSGFVQSYPFIYRKRQAQGLDSDTDALFRLLAAGQAGDDRIKARLICSLARASGIPARVVMNLNGGFWSELWIAGLGWISVDVSYPVYDYVKPVRVSFPRVFTPNEAPVVSFSQSDDTLALLRWNRHIRADYRQYPSVAGEDRRDVSQAVLVFVKVMTEDMLPEAARVKLTDNLFFRAVQKKEGVFLEFKDRHGRRIKNRALDFRGLASTVRAGEGFFWRFRPVMVGDVLIIENLTMVIQD